MNAPTSESYHLPKWLLPASLGLPVAALVAFHIGNIQLFGQGPGSFLRLPYEFLTRIWQYRIEFPPGFFGWMFRAVLGMAGPSLLGWAILGRTGIGRSIRFWASFPIGLGFAGVALEALAMAGRFHAVGVASVYLLSFAIGLVLTLTNKRPLQAIQTEIVQPSGPVLRVFSWTAFCGLIYLSFQHSLLLPPTYHDALIYYLYYSKLIFLNQGIPFPVDAEGFPILVQGQVGLGLGANYAHLFLLWQASVCTLAGEWSSLPGQFIPPLAGLATALLVYSIALFRWKSERVALWCLLLVQSVPYWLWYQQWVSDYPLAVWFTIAAAALVLTGDSRSLRVFLGLVGIAIAGSHLNYLMVTLWWFPLLVWIARGKCRYDPKVLVVFALGLVLSSTWFVRNWVVTGNPVYAFFPEIFGGTNVDLRVLRSCEVEWTLSGDGLLNVGNTFFERILGTPSYFLLNPRLSIKWATLPVGWFVPGLLCALLLRKRDLFLWAVLPYAALLFFYEYAISALYLYHVMPLVPLMVLIAGEWMAAFDRDKKHLGRIHTVLVFAVVWTVGLPADLYGAKLFSSRLFHTLAPGHDPEGFLRTALASEYPTWQVMNDRLPQGSTILTHENRHYYLRDDLVLLHLDDYRLIPWYDRPKEEVLARLRELGVDYYLKVPFEENHPILKELGIQDLLDSSFTLLFASPDRRYVLYALLPPPQEPTRAGEP